MLFRLERKILNGQRIASPGCFLTVHDHAHILDETMDNLKSMSRGIPSLVLGESVQSLQDRFDILLPEQVLHKFNCVTVSKGIT
jgi:hypothetical protein